MPFNKTGPEYIEWIKSRDAITQRNQPEQHKKLKEAQDALEERRIKRELDKEFDIGEDDE